MKKPKININKEKIASIGAMLVAKKKLIFILIGFALFVYSAGVLYKNMYLSLVATDYIGSGNFFTSKKENEIIKEIIDNTENKRKAAQTEVGKQYKNPFGVENSQLNDNVYDGGLPNYNDERTISPSR